jgi:hypothetical protein
VLGRIYLRMRRHEFVHAAIHRLGEPLEIYSFLENSCSVCFNVMEAGSDESVVGFCNCVLDAIDSNI